MNEIPFALAIQSFGERLDVIGASQWSTATPCADWDVRALVNHVMGELLWMPSMLEGKTIEEVGDRFEGDLVGEDPLARWSAAAVAAQESVSAPDAMERTVHLSFGDHPASLYLGQVTTDLLIHSWDLARAIGADERLDSELVEWVDRFLSPQVEEWRKGGAFGPAVEVAADADAQDRLLAQTGRNPRR